MMSLGYLFNRLDCATAGWLGRVMVELVGVVLLLVLLSACAAPATNPPLDLAERFRLVAFRDGDGAPMALVRWERPISAVMTGATTDQVGLVSDHLVYLGEITGLQVGLVMVAGSPITPGGADWVLYVGGNPFGGGDGAMSVHFVSRDDHLREILGRSIRRVRWMSAVPSIGRFTCFTAVGELDGSIMRWAFIRNDQSERDIRRCVVQETTQLLGLYGDTEGRTDTAFSSGIGADHLTAADRALLAILYDPRLEVGMDEATAMPIVRAIIAERFPAGP